MPHAHKPKAKPKKAKRKRRRKRKTAKVITPGFGDFRRPRRFAFQPKRGPASVLHKHSAAFMLGALAQDMLTPMRPAPNWLTQRAPPFLPYDPWQEQRRHTRIADDRQRAQMRREIEAELRPGAPAAVARAAPPAPPFRPYARYPSWGEIGRAADRYRYTGDPYIYLRRHTNGI